MAKKIEMTKEEKEIYNELKKLANTANARLRKLEQYMGRANSWGAKNLRDKLSSEPVQAWTKGNRVSVSKNMTLSQMQATTQALQKFINNSKTSTIRGINKIRETTIENFRVSLGIDKKLSREEGEFYYRLFEDTDYSFFVPKYFTASDFDPLIQEAKEENYSVDEFVDLISAHLFGLDSELRERAIAFYNKYIKS